MDSNHAGIARTSAQLLRDEISAVETYDRALDTFRSQPEATVLANIAQNHREAVATLSNQVVDAGGDPELSSDAWGDFSTDDTAMLFGQSAALSALIAGERAGISGYQAALEDGSIDEQLKIIIRQHFLPRHEEHVVALNGLRQ